MGKGRESEVEGGKDVARERLREGLGLGERERGSEGWVCVF